ncbi:hypothetical protein QU606_20350 [Pseudomonas sp. OVF7]|nr:hypothetical protein [Pseudomonas sp. OVF7]WLD64704.1 hypothetical protein QU606_20350 [Pseudomonas sp. OVF7]
MSFPFVVLDHMANNQRTYEWVNGRVHEVGVMKAERPRNQRMGIQTGLLVFTLSSLVMIFAGGALAVVAVILYSVLFG